MISATVIGHVGQAAIEERGGYSVLRFSVASNRKIKGEQITTWVDCTLLGKRAEGLAPHLQKGARVAVTGELWVKEHEGKRYVKLDVANVELIGRPEPSERRERPASE
ncbi:MAG TPA: single-stranded DNA-binding protein, partial [Polyangiaceae bacterium]|nr:single-stranded DNA-binding protein [Polyangiaceae bacterium]